MKDEGRIKENVCPVMMFLLGGCGDLTSPAGTRSVRDFPG